MEDKQPQCALVRLLRKAVHRMGATQVWRIAATLRALTPSPPSATAVRAALRQDNVYIADDDFARLVTAFAVHDGNSNNNSNGDYSSGPDGAASRVDVGALLGALAQCTLSPRRRFVVDLVLRKLQADESGAVANTTLHAHYDALRHPDVVNQTRSAEAVVARFFAQLQLRLPETAVEAGGEHNTRRRSTTTTNNNNNNNDDEDNAAALRSSVSVEELRLYLAGVSEAHGDDDDAAFELLCARAFCLDRPRLSFDDETRRLQGSQAMYRATRLIAHAHAHPLYATTSSTYGTGCSAEDAPLPRPTYGRVQRFTRSLPAPLGGATTMNM